jgi:NAD(P)-dependent dehydrogenase (short-subunit alcohol dehydrogenase family)
MQRAGDRFTGKVAIVTGGGSGIGRATSLRLASEGASVLVMDISETAGNSVASEIGPRAAAVAGDITRAADIDAAIGRAEEVFGPVDVLVNNAALTIKATFAECAPADWDREFDVTLRGAYLFCRAILPRMVARGSGAIVNIGSVNALMYFGNPAYSAAKAALLSLTRSLAVEAGPHGVRVNMVSPGTVRTGAASWTVRQQRDPAIFEKLARWYPVGRVGNPEDIAAAVAFLAADEAGFVNGTNLVVDGGLTAGMAVMAEEITLERGAP